MSFYLEGILPRVESSDGEAVTEGLCELELRAVRALEAVCDRVKLQGSGQGQCYSHLGAGDEAVGGGVGVITTWGYLEILVVIFMDCIQVAFFKIIFSNLLLTH